MSGACTWTPDAAMAADASIGSGPAAAIATMAGACLLPTAPLTVPQAAAAGIDPRSCGAAAGPVGAAGAFSMGLATKVSLLYAYWWLMALWAYAVVTRAPAGWARLALALPLVLFNLAAPLLLDYRTEPLLITPLAGAFSLSAFKLLAFCLDRGPLALAAAGAHHQGDAGTEGDAAVGAEPSQQAQPQQDLKSGLGLRTHIEHEAAPLAAADDDDDGSTDGAASASRTAPAADGRGTNPAPPSGDKPAAAAKPAATAAAPDTKAAHLAAPVRSLAARAAHRLIPSAGPGTPWTLLQFIIIFGLPTIPMSAFRVSGGAKPRCEDQLFSPRRLVRAYFKQMGVALVACWVLLVPGLPVMARHWLYTLCSASFLAAVFDLAGAAAEAVSGLPMAPTFDRPWLCSSFQDFWARRWNLCTTYVFRVLVYEPVVEGRWVAEGTAAAAAAAACASSRVPAAQAVDGGLQRGPQQRTDVSDGGSNGNSGSNSGSNSKAGDAADAAAELSLNSLSVNPGSTLKGRENGATSPSAAGDSCGEGKGGAAEPRPTKLRPSALRRFLALQGTFLFSGAWHILIFWYNTHVFSWRWCLFFTVQVRGQ